MCRDFRSGRRIRAAMLALLIPCWAGAAQASDLTPAETRGKTIYFEGRSQSGDAVTAFVGQRGTALPASAMPCGSCHGDDGLGRPERGVIPPNIMWSNLTKVYGHTHSGGRKHPAYTEETFKGTLTKGRDPAGNALDPAMPRYAMSGRDVVDLVAYLKRLGADLDPGLGGDLIRLGSIVPTGKRLGALGSSLKQLLTAFFKEVNERGGVHGRRIELAFADRPDSLDAMRTNARRLIQKEKVFALVSPFTRGMEGDVARLAREVEMPLVAAYAHIPDGESEGLFFYLMPGLAEQARALVEYAANSLDLKGKAAAIIHPNGPQYVRIAQAITRQGERHGWKSFAAIAGVAAGADAGRLVRGLSGRGIGVLFHFGSSGELDALVREADRAGWHPVIMLPGSLASRSLMKVPAGFADKIYLAFPTGPSDQSPAVMREFVAFHKRNGLPKRHMAVQISAYASAKVLMEGLKRAGRSLNRRKFMSALEKFDKFATGLTPPLSFAPNRRIGAYGAHIVTVDTARQQFRPVGGWIELDHGRGR